MQSTDSLRELNAKLLAEIAELRKENAEISELREKLLKFAEVEVENVRLKQIIEKNARRDAENVELKSRVRELEARLALLEQGSAVDKMVLSFGQTQNVGRAPSDLDGNDEEVVNFLDEAYKKSISNEIRERRREKKQKDQEALVISQNVTKIPEVTDMLTSEQDEQDLSQSYEASSESIRSAFCILSKQPQVNASKLTCNLENREDSSRSELCDMEKLKSDLHNEVIAKLDKNIIVEQELKQQLLTPAHTSTSDQTLEEQDPSSDTAQNIVCMFRKANKLGQEAILYWCYFIEKYDKRIDNLVVGGVKKKTATSMVYQEIKQLLPDITDVNLRQKILRARKLYKLFNTLGIEKIKQVSYSADVYFGSILAPNTKYYKSSKVSTSENVLSAFQSNPTYDYTYFRNKTLDQYPTLYREFSSENFDYYGITDETSCEDYICPLCKLGHDDKEIEGRYKTGSYFKCEQRKIEIVA
ncbi:uncharacterized protein OCT59_016769 [Rhizophagus irregularis]|uniref:uncharacterized protein n=1 Tax=Rhizophagus irregularis TaxID=588596 RepID=UPI00332718A9|nr:hypothetical protein OCT59_016769 [Rhizophagus irregularis]